MESTPLTAQSEILRIAEDPKKNGLPMRMQLRATMKGGWPWTGNFRVPFTIRADPMYRTYTTSGSPSELFEKASGWLIHIKEMELNDEKEEIIGREVTGTMCRAIFGSNHIERVGLSQEMTVSLCRRIIAGHDVGDEVLEGTPEYEALPKGLIDQQKAKKEKTHKHVIRSRREVIQHARAFQYLIYAMVVQNELLTEDLIKKVHSILCNGVDITHDDGNETPSTAEMAIFVAAFNDEVQQAEEDQCLDPFALAAKYCLLFVQIHPFQDGNGRTCRMILNAILCKYAGIIVPIGEHDEERAEYLGIKQRASERWKELENSQHLCCKEQQHVFGL